MSDGKQTFVERLPVGGKCFWRRGNKALVAELLLHPTYSPAHVRIASSRACTSSRTALLDNDIFMDASGKCKPSK